MGHQPPPELSVVFVAADQENLVAMLAALRRQTIRGVMEVVLVIPEGSEAKVNQDDGEAFQDLQTVSCDAQAWLGSALARGVRHATAPWVALIEDHCFPEPGWAGALLRRHREGYTVVGPEIRNANPDTALSWCSFMLTHGAWATPAEAGVVSTVAGDNSSYRRDAILERRAGLETPSRAGRPAHRGLRGPARIPERR